MNEYTLPDPITNEEKYLDAILKNVSGYTTTQMVVTYDDDSTATFNVMVVSAS